MSGKAWRKFDVGFYEGRPEELMASYRRIMAGHYSDLAGKVIARASHDAGLLRLEFCDGTGCEISAPMPSLTGFIWGGNK